MESGKAADFHASLPGNDSEQADARRAYIQAKFKGDETWVYLPEVAWPDSWYNSDGSKKYTQPIVRLDKALYGHPNSGTYWEKHCDTALRKQKFIPVENWASCYYHADLD